MNLTLKLINRVILLCISIMLLVRAENLGEDELILRKLVGYLNILRRQLTLAGVRKLYWHEDMAVQAREMVKHCDASLRKETGNGNDGSFTIKLGSREPLKNAHSILNAKNYRQLTRDIVDRHTGKCRPGTDEDSCLQSMEIYNPQVWLIGCAANTTCEPEGIIVCVVNRRSKSTELILRESKSECPECSESFECNEHELVCHLKDPTFMRHLPEDSKELMKPQVRGMGSIGSAQSESLTKEDSLDNFALTHYINSLMMFSAAGLITIVSLSSFL